MGAQKTMRQTTQSNGYWIFGERVVRCAMFEMMFNLFFSGNNNIGGLATNEGELLILAWCLSLRIHIFMLRF